MSRLSFLQEFFCNQVHFSCKTLFHEFSLCRFLESLLNYLLKLHPISLPRLHFDAEFSGSLPINRVWPLEENEGCANGLENALLNKKRKCNKKTISGKSDISGNPRQRTLVDTFERAGVLGRERISSKVSSTVLSSEKTSQTAEHEEPSPNQLGIIEMSAVPTILYAQESKFRVLDVSCLSILSLYKVQHCSQLI